MPKLNLQQDKELYRCMAVQMTIGNCQLKALLDTGCKSNLIFKAAYEKLNNAKCLLKTIMLKEGWNINGIGNKPIKVQRKVQVNMKLYDAHLGPKEFFVVDIEKEDYDIVLGLDFIKETRILINPKRNVIIWENKELIYEIHLNDDDLLPKRRIVKAYPVVAKESVKIMDQKPTLIEVNWKKNLLNINNENIKDLFLEGNEASPRIKEKIHVYEGIVDINNLKVCVQLKPKNSTDTFTIKKGEVLGKVYTIEDEINIATGIVERTEKWEKEKLFTVLKFGNLNPEQKEKAKDLCWEYRDVISTGKEEIGCSKLPPFKIEVTDDIPVYIRPRHFPSPLTDEIENECDKMEGKGIIETSESPWNAAIVPVRKPDKTLRICIDYRKLNEKTIKNRFPMKLISDCVYNMKGMNWFTKLDLEKGYYQMPIEESSRKYTAFSTSSKHYQFKALSFGLANAPAAFQSAMNVEFADLPKKNVANFMDDTMIMSETFNKNLEITRKILEKLRACAIMINPAKCEWFMSEVGFLGHKIGRMGLKKSDQFIEKVREFPRPKTVKDLKGFLGLIEFQRKFIKGCSSLTKPLSKWTGKPNKTEIMWDEQLIMAFNTLRQRAADDVELAYPDYSKDANPLEVWTDASGFGVGGMLTQVQDKESNGYRRVIGYVSKSLNKAEKRYSTIERELAGLRFAVKAFRPFLYGLPFVLKTDHQPLVYLNRMKVMDNRLARTYEDLADFEYSLEYIPGERNQVADLMSRIPANLIESRVMQGDAEKWLPPGLEIDKVMSGGSLSMFECLHDALHTMQDPETKGSRNPRGPKRKMPQSALKLREEVIDEAIAQPEMLGFPKIREYKKMLQAMKYNITPYQEVLITFSDLYEVIVHVHFGDKKPIIYRCHRMHFKSKRIIHLQCLGGTHYNLVRETSAYCSLSEKLHQKDHDVQFEEHSLPDIQILFGEKTGNESIFCQHQRPGGFTVYVHQNSTLHCCLIDTGAQIGLIKRSILNKLQVKYRRKTNVKIQGITNMKCVAMEQVFLNFKIQNYEREYEMGFLVLEDSTFPYCILLGVDFLRRYDITVDPAKGRLTTNERTIGDVEVNLTTMMEGTPFMAAAQIELVDNQEIIEDGEILEWQELSQEIKKVKEAVDQNRKMKDWSESIKIFKRYAKKMTVIMSTLYYLMEGEYKEQIPVPILPLPIAIGLTIMVHQTMLVHLGKHKLWMAMKNICFYPGLQKICEDVATTCERCQLFKQQNAPAKPPLRRIDAKEPFELMVTDCLNLPRTTSGSIGLVILTDHKSKMTWASTLKNKTSKHVADQIEKFIFPTLVMKPASCLSDNGPEFIGAPFEEMLKRNGVKGLKITPYMSSSNGLAERTLQTLTELLRLAQENGQEWDENLPKVLWSYNSTKHAAHGTSPKNFLIKALKMQEGKVQLNIEDEGWWRRASEKYRSFEVGEKVIIEKKVIGRRVENKLQPKFEGPFTITNKWENEVSYVVSRIYNQVEETKRVHQKHMRKWREPPLYIKNHPIYSLARRKDELTRDEWNKISDEELEVWPKQIVVSAPITPAKLSKATQTLPYISIESPLEKKIGPPQDEGTPIGEVMGFFIDDEFKDISAEVDDSSGELLLNRQLENQLDNETLYSLTSNLKLVDDDMEDEQRINTDYSPSNPGHAEEGRRERLSFVGFSKKNDDPPNKHTLLKKFLESQIKDLGCSRRDSKERAIGIASADTTSSSSFGVRNLARLFEEIAEENREKVAYNLRSAPRKNR